MVKSDTALHGCFKMVLHEVGRKENAAGHPSVDELPASGIGQSDPHLLGLSEGPGRGVESLKVLAMQVGRSGQGSEQHLGLAELQVHGGGQRASSYA